MKFDGGMILGLEDQIEAQEAIGELVDNAVDAGASRIDIVLSSGSMTVTDNGSGCEDPYNEIGTPFQSRSRKKSNKIGVKGVGGNQAMATFGRRWVIQTVTRTTTPIYRRLEMVWNPDGPLPPDRTTRESALSAPAEIRKGGTRITVTQRQSGLDYNVERIARWLERTYRPALGRNLAITFKAPEEGFSRSLRNNALEANRFEEPLVAKTGVAAGRTFTVTYGVMKKSDDTLQGCNLIFYPRVLKTLSSVGKYPLPSLAFIDVELGPKWKTLLATNKTRIRELRELEQALADLLSVWIEKLQSEATSIRINLMMGEATGRVNSKIAFLDKLVAGEFGPKPRKVAEPGPAEPRPKPNPERIIIRRRTRAYPDGKFGVEPDANSCLRLDLQADKNLGLQLYRSAFSATAGILTVFINTGPEQRLFEKAANSDGKFVQEKAIAEAERIGYFALAEMCASPNTKEDVKPIFAALRKLGYEIDTTTAAHTIMRMVLNYLYDQVAAPGGLRVIQGGKAA